MVGGCQVVGRGGPGGDALYEGRRRVLPKSHLVGGGEQRERVGVATERPLGLELRVLMLEPPPLGRDTLSAGLTRCMELGYMKLGCDGVRRPGEGRGWLRVARLAGCVTGVTYPALTHGGAHRLEWHGLREFCSSDSEMSSSSMVPLSPLSALSKAGDPLSPRSLATACVKLSVNPITKQALGMVCPEAPLTELGGGKTRDAGQGKQFLP